MTRGAVRFTLNGRPAAIESAPGESLLDALRERCGVTSIKDGCQPQGQCGCGLALIDGKPLVTCAFEAARAEGREVLTLEGISAREPEVISRSVAAAGGVQCGFCIPGIALRAKHLLDRKPDPGRDEIARAIDGHLCRCTGYTQIVEAIGLMARAWRGGELPVPARDGGVGKPLARYGGREQALGVRPYVADMRREGLLHGALVLSAHARARVVRIHTSKAAELDGVRKVVTAADVPGPASATASSAPATGRSLFPCVFVGMILVIAVAIGVMMLKGHSKDHSGEIPGWSVSDMHDHCGPNNYSAHFHRASDGRDAYLCEYMGYIYFSIRQADPAQVQKYGTDRVTAFVRKGAQTIQDGYNYITGNTVQGGPYTPVP